MISHMCTMKILLVILGHFTEPGAMQFIIQPGDTTLTLNQMSNATFHCSCPDCDPEPPPYWVLEIDGDHFDITNPSDRPRLALRGINFNRSGLSVVISIPDRIENNNTMVMCAAFLGGVEFSDPVKVTIIGPPLPPKPALVINSSSQLDIKWGPPYSHVDYPVVSYNIQIVNVSSGGILEMAELQSNETSYVYFFDDDVRYCQNLTVNVTAVSALGSSVPGLVSRGFPIAPPPFVLDIDNVKVTFLRNGTLMANISFEAPVICDYQMANYTLTVKDISDPGVNLKPIESSYTGRNRYIMGVIASGLMIDHNYTLYVSVVESHFKLERSQSINFTTVFQSRDTGTSSAMQPTIQEGDKILALNQMSNATFHCTCDECTTSPHWNLENEGTYLSTDNNIDREILAQRGITFSSSGTSAVISIPNRVENNSTMIRCVGFLEGSNEFSYPPVKVIITGPPLPPEPILVINGFSQLDIQWEIPYSHVDYPVESYSIQIVNMSSGEILESQEEYNGTIYVYTFDDDVQYCQILSVNVTAVSALGSSEPGSASRGFPIAPQTFQSEVNVEVILQDNETAISFMAPFICDYQTASYTLTIEDITDPNSESLTRGSVYSGSNRSIMETITSGLQNNHNYTLSISVVDEDFNIKVSTALDFSSIINTTMIYATTFFQQTDPTLPTTTVSATTLFQQTDTEVPTSPTTTVNLYATTATTLFQQTRPKDAGCCDRLSLRAVLMCLILLGLCHTFSVN